MATNTGRRTYDTFTRICSTWAKDTGRRTSGMSARADVPESARADIYSPCATDTGKQGELDLCTYADIRISA